MRIPSIILLLAALLVALVLPACGGGGGGSSTPTTPPQDDTMDPPTNPPGPTSFVYWRRTDNNSVMRAPIDGGTGTVVVTGPTNGLTVAGDSENRQLYYSEVDRISRVDEDGGSLVSIASGGATFAGLAVDNTSNAIFFADFGAGAILTSDLDGQGITPVLTMLTSPEGVAVDPVNQRVYYTLYNSGAIGRVDYDGNNAGNVVTSIAGQPVGIAVNPTAGRIYYASRGATIRTADLDGGSPSDLVTGQGSVAYIAIDVAGGKIYWVDEIAQMVRRANLADGSSVEDVAATGGPVWGLALIIAAP